MTQKQKDLLLKDLCGRLPYRVKCEVIKRRIDGVVYHDYVNGGWTMVKTFDDEYDVPYWFVDFCNKNHLDYRGLIPMGLAIDATGLNIY